MLCLFVNVNDYCYIRKSLLLDMTKSYIHETLHWQVITNVIFLKHYVLVNND